MTNDIQIVSDGDGVAIFGDDRAVEKFINSAASLKAAVAEHGSHIINIGAVLAHASSMFASESGRWLKLTAESAAELRNAGKLMPTKTPGVDFAMLGNPGDINNWLRVESATMNPVVLSNVGALMAQAALQHQIDAITDYLEIIDKKLDAVLRTQINQVLARLDGVDLVIRESIAIKDTVGRVSDVNWSKLHTATQTINEVLAFSLRHLADTIDPLTAQKTDELLDAVTQAERDTQKWLQVIARCLQLHDQVTVLELGRVQASQPDELDRHRLGLKAAQAERHDSIRLAINNISTSVDIAAGTANSKVLFNPIQSPRIVSALNNINDELNRFSALLKINTGYTRIESRRWSDAATEQVDRALTVGGNRLGAAVTTGKQSVDKMASAAGRLGRRSNRRPSDDRDIEDPSISPD